MESEVRTCQSCSNSFSIEPEDFQFYDKMKVPPPIFCPDCRLQRRYAWRNERTMYRRNCDLCKKSVVSLYSPSKPYVVYCSPCWWSDAWDPADFGQDFDPEKSFFEQLKTLQLKVPRIALFNKNSVNSDYTNHASDNKNCYLSASIFYSENIYYSTNVWRPSRDCMDCYLASSDGGGELVYECVDSGTIFNCQYGILLKNCRDCFYCYDCRGCSDCFLSSNLRNKKYCILNQQYTKDEYEEKIKSYDLSSYAVRQELMRQFQELLNSSLHKSVISEKSHAVSGNMIFQSKNTFHAFDANEVEDSKYVVCAVEAKNSMDAYHFGYSSELIYEAHAIIRSYNAAFSHASYDNSHIQYCDNCHNTENLFGCIGVKRGSYMILNKRYEPEEYRRVLNDVIDSMKARGEYGQFFPPALAPFAYNETQAQVYMPLAEEAALRLGFQWEHELPGTFGKETLTPERIPDRIADVSDSILKEILVCTSCARNYNIVEPEFQLYKRLSIPIPRKCPECRYKFRLGFRPPRKLRRRMCDCQVAEHTHGASRCSTEFETAYAPDRPEIVYCEPCYQAEVI